MCAKKRQPNKLTHDIQERLETIAEKTQQGELNIARILQSTLSHPQKHSAQTTPRDITGNDRKYFTDPTRADVPTLCLARAIEPGADQTDNEDKSYFTTNQDLATAFADNVLKNSSKIAQFYKQDKQIDMCANAPLQAAGPDMKPKACVIRRDAQTGAIREYKAHSTNLVMFHSQTSTPRATPKLTGLTYKTIYPCLDKGKKEFETGRDLRYDVSKTRQFSESTPLGKAYLLSCCNPEITPVPCSFLDISPIEPKTREQVRIPLAQATIIVNHEHGNTTTMLYTKQKQLLPFDDDRVQKAIQNTNGLCDPQVNFLNDLLNNVRNPDAFMPSQRKPAKTMAKIQKLQDKEMDIL